MDRPAEPVNSEDFPSAQLAAKVRELRAAEHLTQGQLARRAGYTRTYVTLIESGTTVPGREVVERLDDALSAGGALLALRSEAESKRWAVLPEVARGRSLGAERLASTLDHTDDRLVLYETLMLGFDALGVDLHQRRFLKAIGASLGSIEALNRPRRWEGSVDPGSGASVLDDEGRVDPATVADISLAIGVHRRLYRRFSAEQLLPATLTHMRMASQLAKIAPRRLRDELVSSIGQASMLGGTLLLHDLGDPEIAGAYYKLTETAARRLDDQEMRAYLLGCTSFLACYGGDRREAVRLIEEAVQTARNGASPETRAWLHAVAGEIHATAGEAGAAMRSLEASRSTLDHADYQDPTWLGIGAFDQSKLDAYYGTCYLRMHDFKAACRSLTEALDGLPGSWLKHRCTALLDLALAQAGLDEVDAACEHGIEAIKIILTFQHAVNTDRLKKLRHMLDARSSSRAVREFDSYLSVVA